jgi:hypothetical protein
MELHTSFAETVDGEHAVWSIKPVDAFTSRHVAFFPFTGSNGNGPAPPWNENCCELVTFPATKKKGQKIRLHICWCYASLPTTISAATAREQPYLTTWSLARIEIYTTLGLNKSVGKI